MGQVGQVEQVEQGTEKATAKKRCKNQQGGRDDSGTRWLELKLLCQVARQGWDRWNRWNKVLKKSLPGSDAKISKAAEMTLEPDSLS